MVIHVAEAQWRPARHTVTGLLAQMEAVVGEAALTRTWTSDQARDAAHLTSTLRRDWHHHRLDTQHLAQLDRLSGALDVTACTLMRAHLEATRHCLATCLGDVLNELTVPTTPARPSGL